MKPTVLVSALGLVAFVACQPPPETPEAAQARMETEAAAARTALDSMAQAFAEHVNMGHADVVAGFYAEDAVLMPPNAPAAIGRAAIQEVWAGLIAMQPQLTVTPLSVSANGPLAVDRGSYSLTFTPPGASQPMTDTGKYLAHWHLVDGRWILVEDIWNSDLPAPPPPPPPARRR